MGELKAGKSAEEICCRNSIGQSTLYRWKSKYGDMDRAELNRLRELVDDNHRLKRIVAQQVLDIDALKDLLPKN